MSERGNAVRFCRRRFPPLSRKVRPRGDGIFLLYPEFRLLSFFLSVLMSLFCTRRVLRFFAPGNFSVIRSLFFFVFLFLVTVVLRYPGFRFLSFFVSFDESVLQ